MSIRMLSDVDVFGQKNPDAFHFNFGFQRLGVNRISDAALGWVLLGLHCYTLLWAIN